MHFTFFVGQKWWTCDGEKHATGVLVPCPMMACYHTWFPPKRGNIVWDDGTDHRRASR